MWMLCGREPLNTFMAVSFVNKVGISSIIVLFFSADLDL